MNFLDQTQESWFTSYILINYEFQRRKRNTIIHIMKTVEGIERQNPCWLWPEIIYICVLLFFVLLLVLKTEKLTPLNYDDTFAYGCLHDIPIPNSTLETTFTPQQERAVLMEIFDQTDGHKWRKSTHWGNNSVSHCLWYGITCDQTNSYIISITLTKNKLVGALPRSLGKLRNLQGLCESDNDRLSGNLIEILSANMTT